ncbi:helix-turn-helix transcriptional regulator [Aquibacillus saliphilus]|uniref:helix-turn-helix transcriptional regulator n=1 Tax=Aquibacillus saliphilus TaxID=1909422 RepID=UPI001CF0B484|nr:transcriptional regulator [Aquibacillus saliphilus]
MIKKSSVKEKILLQLKQKNKLSIVQLMENFQITDIALRRHIHKLEQDGYINSFQEKQTVGRPYHIYQLTPKGEDIFPSHYQQFSVDLLKELEELKGKDFVYQLLASRAEKTTSEYKSKIANEEDYLNRIEKLVQVQEEKGYMTDLQTNTDGSYTLKQFNCPISSVAHEYKGICEQEVDLFTELLKDSKVVASTCIVNGANCCSFLIEDNRK